MSFGSSIPDSYAAGRTWTVSGAGKKYAVSKPICVGNLGTGAGMLHYANVSDLHLKAVQATYNWSTSIGLSGEVPSDVLVLAYQFNFNADDSNSQRNGIDPSQAHLSCTVLAPIEENPSASTGRVNDKIEVTAVAIAARRGGFCHVPCGQLIQ